MNEVWDRTLSLLAQRLSQEEVGRWFKPLKPQPGQEPGVLSLLAPHRFFIDWIRDNHLAALEETVSSAMGREARVELRTDPEKAGKPEKDLRSEARPSPSRTTADPRLSAGLNTKYNFNNFVIGESNRFAHAAAFAVANLPGQTYNPLFIYSAAGLGKTHLMNAVGNQILSGDPGCRIVYVSCESFTNQMIQSIRDKSMDRFRDRYRGIDVLLIDDIQFLGNKEGTQEEFFFTFNSLYDTGHQIVLTSDQKPKDIHGLEDRLRSRFEWGLIADIQAPDAETKTAIIHKKAEEEGFNLPDEVAYRLASTEESNIRVLEGYLVRMAAYSSMTGQPITLSLAQQVLQDALFKKEVTTDEIIRMVALRYGLRLSDLRSAKRQRKISEPRQIAMYLVRKLTGASLVQIGAKFGGKDHSTVVHAVKKITTRMSDDLEFRRQVDQLERSIRESG